MGLPVGQVGSSRGKDFGEKVVRKKEGSHARADGHASEVPQSAAANAAENIVGQVLGGYSLFAGALQNVNLVVQLVVKVAGHRGGMDGADINAQGLQFNVQTAGELAHKGLGSTVHARKWSWDETGNTGSEDDAALLLFTDPFGGKVVGNVDNRSSIACLEKTNEENNNLRKHDKSTSI